MKRTKTAPLPVDFLKNARILLEHYDLSIVGVAYNEEKAIANNLWMRSHTKIGNIFDNPEDEIDEIINNIYSLTQLTNHLLNMLDTRHAESTHLRRIANYTERILVEWESPTITTNGIRIDVAKTINEIKEGNQYV